MYFGSVMSRNWKINAKTTLRLLSLFAAVFTVLMPVEALTENKRATVRASDGHVYEIQYTNPLNVADFYIYGLNGEVPSREVAAELYNATKVLNLPPLQWSAKYLEGEVKSAYSERLDTEIVLATTNVVAAAAIGFVTGGGSLVIFTLDMVKDGGLEFIEFTAKDTVLSKAMLIALTFASNAKHYEAMVNDHWLAVDKGNETSIDEIKAVWSARLKEFHYETKTYDMMTEHILAAQNPLEHILGWIPFSLVPDGAEFFKARVLEQKDIDYLNTLSETIEEEIMNTVALSVDELFSKAAIDETIATLEQAGFYNRQSPVIREEITERWLTPGGDARFVDITTKFSDPNGDSLTFKLKEGWDRNLVDMEWIHLNVFGEPEARLMLEITPKARLGETWVTVVATDPNRLSVEQSFKVVVAPANAPPQLSRPLPPQTLTPGSSSEPLDLTTYFYDLDSERIATYMASSANTAVATVQPSTGSVITISAIGIGETTVTVTATDSDGASTTTDIAISVEGNTPAPENPASESPDLSIETISVDVDMLSPGERFRVSVSVKNVGGRRATNTTLHYYLSKDSTYSRDDKEFKDWRDRLPTFDVNAIENDHANLDAPDTPGDYYIIVRAERVRNERNTTNNYASVKITVLPPPAPDLVVSLTVDPSPRITWQSANEYLIYPQKYFRLDATINNRGKKESEETEIHFYRSSDPLPSLDDTKIETGRVKALRRADSRFYNSDEESENGPAPEVPGDYYYYAYVDSVEGEVNTDNNYSNVIKVSVRGPDLVIASASVDYLASRRPEVFPNGKIELHVTVQNQGTDDSHSTNLRFYVSSDATFSEDDTEVSEKRISSFDINESRVQKPVSIYVPYRSRFFYCFVCIDGVEDEIDTDNNCSAPLRVNVRNATPLAKGTIADQTLNVGIPMSIDVSQYFSDENNDTLTYNVSSSDTTVASVSAPNNVVTITPKLAGSATITVTASDDEWTATQTIFVTVNDAVSVDVNGDGRVNILDLVIVANNFGKDEPDLNGDGVVNILDLVRVAEQMGTLDNEGEPQNE